jgi:tellurite resistance protein TehA-like permease
MRADTLFGWLGHEIATIHPGCFAMVMATGIISNTLYFTGQAALSIGLAAIGGALLCWLAVATLIRTVRFPVAMRGDLGSPALVFSFFTIVAALGVTGVGLHLRGYAAAALALWVTAFLVWLVLTYVSFGVLVFRNRAESAKVVHGGWLIAIVGTQSLVVLGTMLAPDFPRWTPAILLLLYMLWGIGLGLYGIFVTLFAYRLFFFSFTTEDVTPLLWVVMGAAAISTNAGAVLVLTEHKLDVLTSIEPFLTGMTLLIWAWGSWWIPLLVLLGWWKHGVRKVPLRYSPMLWSLVFPLGMYALASLRLSLVSGFAPLHRLADGMIWIALATWAATAAGLLLTLPRRYGAFAARA